MTLNYYLTEDFDDKLSLAYGGGPLPDDDEYERYTDIFFTRAERQQLISLLEEVRFSPWSSSIRSQRLKKYYTILSKVLKKRDLYINTVNPALWQDANVAIDYIKNSPLPLGESFDPGMALPDDDEYDKKMYCCDACDREYYDYELLNCMCGSNYCRKCAGSFYEIHWDGAGISTCPNCTGRNPLEHLGEGVNFDPGMALPDDDEYEDDEQEYEVGIDSSLIILTILAPGSQENAVEFAEGIVDMYTRDAWGDYEVVGSDPLLIARGYGDQEGFAAFVAARYFKVPGHIKLYAYFNIGDIDMTAEMIRRDIQPTPVKIKGAIIIPNTRAWVSLPEVQDTAQAFHRDVEGWEAGGEPPPDVISSSSTG